MKNEFSKTDNNFLKIQDLLMKEWDPIGINDVPEAYDEYDSYAQDIYFMLKNNFSATDIFNYLIHMESEHIGLDPDIRMTRLVSQKLARLILD